MLACRFRTALTNASDRAVAGAVPAAGYGSRITTTKGFDDVDPVDLAR
jgi:hypothetical protein